MPPKKIPFETFAARTIKFGVYQGVPYGLLLCLPDAYQWHMDRALEKKEEETETKEESKRNAWQYNQLKDLWDHRHLIKPKYVDQFNKFFRSWRKLKFPLKKHKGKTYEEVIREDPDYIENFVFVNVKQPWVFQLRCVFDTMKREHLKQ